MFTGADILGGTESVIIRWFLAHGVRYGVYVELANDRRYEAIRPIIQRFAGRFIAEVKALYGDV